MIAIPLAWKAIGAGLLLAALVAGYALWHHHVYQSGYDAAIAGVASQNKEAVDARDKAIARLLACRARGGVWDAQTGQCS